MTIRAKLIPKEETLSKKDVKEALEPLGEITELTIEHVVETAAEGDSRDVEWS